MIQMRKLVLGHLIDNLRYLATHTSESYRLLTTFSLIM